ncbi:MAG: hypothetical protein OXJ52_06135 [Oligoflexia bacterium]|nr:hypothetical protein [Oligoflexia bacterium]
MLLRLFFILNLGLALSISAEAAEPPTEEERQEAQARSVERNKEAYVQQMLNRWSACRDNCRATHSKKTNQRCGDDFCYVPYTNEDCDREYCQAEKLTYENHKKKLDDMVDARQRYEESQNQPESDNPLEQVKKKKKDTNLLAYVGAGTTAFLTYKAKVCCSSKSCRASGKCALLIGMATAAGIQTKKMFDKKDDLGETAQAMCADANDPGCTEDDGGNNNEPPIMPPGCEEVPPGTCETINPIVNPPPSECPPEDPDCETEKPKSPGPAMPGPGSGPGSLTGDTPSPTPESAIPKKLGEVFSPPGGWPEGENPWTETTAFDYNKLTPGQKKQMGAIMADLNKKNKAFLDKQGLTGGDTAYGGGVDSDETLGSTGLNGKGGVGSTGSSGVSAGFGKSVDGSRSVAGSEDSMAGTGKPKANSIAEQMKAMLNKMKGVGGSKGDGLGYLGDKSRLVGSDYVGVREDNIFMMVHRMNRKLDEREHRFIEPISF